MTTEPNAEPGSRVLVALATYNERDQLAALIQEIRANVHDVDILVLDDNSPDGTGELADELAAKDSRLNVIHRHSKLGLGTALLAIMNHAINRRYEFLITLDADFSHHPRYMPNLMRGMEQADVVIGSRYVRGGGTDNWPWHRRLMSRLANGLVRVLLGLPVHDASGNYRCYRVSMLRNANLENLLSRGYSFQQEALHRCWLAGARLAETPIVFAERKAGRSKADLAEITSSLWALLRLGWRARFRKCEMMPKLPSD